jgi:hypothetical protein
MVALAQTPVAVPAPARQLATVKRLVEFYVTEDNERIPHAAFEGQTPHEIYFGRGGHSPVSSGPGDATRAAIAWHATAVACAACPRGAPSPSEHLAA